ncbi:MAG: FAD-binding protein [Candidatus Geothermarchaeales archaeon]
MIEADEIIETDVLIIGGGGAASRAAIEATRYGVEVYKIVKGLYGNSGCTPHALGGIAGAFGHADPRDDWWQHFYDTVVGGALLSNQRLVEIFVKEAPQRIIELEEWGSLFDRDREGKYYQRPFGGHTYPRALSSGDRSGAEAMKGLKAEVLRLGVNVMEETMATSLLTDEDGSIAGATCLDIKNGDFLVFKARSVIVASGGMGRLYPLTFAPEGNVGNGYYAAARVGAKLLDMEFLQFHPTGIVWPPGLKGAPISEAVRAIGGRLYNIRGERFMMRYSPSWLELATRDFISRCNYKEIKEGRGTPHGGVYLSVTHIPRETIESQVPTMLDKMLNVGVDIRSEPMEIAPAAHYTDGGILVDENWSVEGVPGLYAAGEASGGVHGANRLGTNSIPELFVTGRIAGENAAKKALEMRDKEVKLDETQVNMERQVVFAPLERRDGSNPIELKNRHMELMWDYVGLVRNEGGLKHAISEMERMWNEDLPRLAVSDGCRHWNNEWLEALDLYSRLFVGLGMAKAALMRTESRAQHYREDHPYIDNENWLRNILISYRDGEIVLETRPVVFTLLKPEEAKLPEFPVI